MDTTEELTHIGLCAGYGGIELGFKRVLPTLRTVALCEIEAFACANLVAKMEAGLMDPAPVWTDLKTFPWDSFRDRVDILTGGYPCQPFSSAGKRAGTDDPRHLWPFISAGIAVLRPSLCFFENVEGHISLGLPDVIEDLGRLGYRTTWGIFSAAEAGAPHQRKRVFIMANRSGARLEGLRECSPTQGRQAQAGHTGGRCDVWPSRPGEPQHAWEPPRIVGDTQRADAVGDDPGEGSKTGMEVGRDCVLHAGGDEKEQFTNASGAEPAMGNPENSDGETREQQRDETRRNLVWHQDNHFGQNKHRRTGCNSIWDQQRKTKPALGGDADGTPSGLDYAELCESCDNRTDELRLLGNGVVPATAALAFRTLLDELQKG